MAEATLNDVVNGLKADNRRLTSIEQNTLDTKEALKRFLSAQQAMAGDQLEAMRELGGKGQGAGSKSPTPDAPGGGMGLLGLLGGLGLIGKTVTAIGVALGVGLGLIVGQMKAIKALVKVLAPGKLIESVRGIKAAWMATVDGIKLRVSDRITAIGQGLSDFFDNIKSKFTIDPESRLGKAVSKIGAIFTKVGDAFADIMRPIRNVITIIQDTIVTGAKSVKSGFVKFSGGISKILAPIGAVARLVGKVFAPIAVIVTAWETITAAIEGYKEEGILGGLKGAITGFFTSLITVPLDMVKNGVAWILEKVGITTPETTEGVKDFSFTEMFTSLVSGIFDKISLAIDWVKTLFTDPVAAIKSLFQGVYGEEGLINTLVWKPISKAIDWVMKKFGFSDEDAPTFDLFTTLSETYDKIKTAFSNGLTDIVNWFKRTPQLIALTVEEKFTEAIAKLKKGFIGVATFIANIPNIIRKSIFGVLVDYKNNSTYGYLLPDFSEQLAASQQAIDAVSGGGADAIAAIDKELERKLDEIDERRQKVKDENTRQSAPQVNSVQGDTDNSSNNVEKTDINLGSSTGSTVDPTYNDLP